MADYLVTDTELTSVANAIRTKGGTSASLSFPTEFVSAIENIPTGSASPTEKDVNFYDYDGTLLHSYTVQEFANVTALPPNPSHTGLTAQGWNYTLAQIRTELTAYGRCNIGQMYITDDGKTRLYIHIDDDTPPNRMTFNLRFRSSVANNVTLDWGDGTSETKGATSDTIYSHTYTNVGDYVVTLKVNSGTVTITSTSANYSIIGTVSDQLNYVNRHRIVKVELGEKINLGNYTFNYCNAIKSITIPSSVTSIGNYSFQFCLSLRHVTIPSTVSQIGNYAFCYNYSLSTIAIPSSVTSIGTNAFQDLRTLRLLIIPSTVTSLGGYSVNTCHALQSISLSPRITSIENYTFQSCTNLRSVIIPSTVTSVGSTAFSACYGLTTITIPSLVTSIGTSAFSNCYGIGEYHMKPTTPPTLTNTNTFNGITSNCIIYVPRSENQQVLNAYKTAQYWSTYANRMQEEPT